MPIADSQDEHEENPRLLHTRATRWLSGHGYRSVRDTLAALTDEVGADELPDVYGTQPIVEDFEREVADLLGKEAAVFFPSGTMAQQIALRIHANRAGRRTIAFHPTCHLEKHEHHGYQRLHGLEGVPVGAPHRVITRADLDSLAEPIAALLLELPQREIGGQLPAWEELEAQVAWARDRGVALHMDGARLWEAGPYYGRSYAEIAALFDTVYVSFYKGLGGITGSILAGPADLIAESRIWMRRHGGNLFHLYPYVLSARARLRERVDRFPAYYARAVSVAGALSTLDGVRIVPDPPQTCMMHVYLEGDRERLVSEAHRMAREEHTFLFADLQPADVPGWSVWEITIGDAAAAFTDDEVRERVARIFSAG
jgi:threonine aldolase